MSKSKSSRRWSWPENGIERPCVFVGEFVKHYDVEEGVVDTGRIMVCWVGSPCSLTGKVRTAGKVESPASDSRMTQTLFGTSGKSREHLSLKLITGEQRERGENLKELHPPQNGSRL